MEAIHTYPMLTKENKFLGLEAIDFLALLVAYLVVFLLSKNLFANAAVIGGVYFFLKLYKKNKPPRHTEHLIRFLLLPLRYTQTWESV